MRCEKLSSTIKRAVSTHQVPGISIALVRDRRTVWFKGFGVKNERAEPVDEQTVYPRLELRRLAVNHQLH